MSAKEIEKRLETVRQLRAIRKQYCLRDEETDLYDVIDTVLRREGLKTKVVDATPYKMIDRVLNNPERDWNSVGCWSFRTPAEEVLKVIDAAMGLALYGVNIKEIG